MLTFDFSECKTRGAGGGLDTSKVKILTPDGVNFANFISGVTIKINAAGLIHCEMDVVPADIKGLEVALDEIKLHGRMITGVKS